MNKIDIDKKKNMKKKWKMKNPTKPYLIRKIKHYDNFFNFNHVFKLKKEHFINEQIWQIYYDEINKLKTALNQLNLTLSNEEIENNNFIKPEEKND